MIIELFTLQYTIKESAHVTGNRNEHKKPV